MSISAYRRRSRRHQTAPVHAAEHRWSLRAIAYYLDDAFLSEPGRRDDVLEDAGMRVPPRAVVSTVRRLAHEAVSELPPDDPTDLPLRRNLAYLGEAIGLSPLEREILALALAIENHRGVFDVVVRAAEIGGANVRREVLAALAAMLDCAVTDVEAAVTPKGTLSATGLLQTSWVSESQQCLEVVDVAKAALQRPTASADELLAQFVEVAEAAELQLADFAHVNREVTLLQRFLGHAAQTQAHGVNVLLHGPPGTGKTQLARLLASTLGLRLFAAKISDSDDDPLDRRDRLRSFQLCQALLQRQRQAIVLFDEVEDAFPEDGAGGVSLRGAGKHKAWSNRLLERNPVPAIWISNVVKHLDPAVIRRFDVVIELKEPPRQARLRMLAKALPANGVSEQWLNKAADDEQLTPADVARASKVAATLTGDDVTLEQAMDWALQGHRALQPGGQRPTYRIDHASYDLEFVHTDIDLPKLVARLQTKPNATICLSGLPGTGKTAFCAHLAQTLGVPFLHARASDLLGMYVGQTEQQIAAMFRKARAQKAVLLLDEADGLLRDRRNARQSWELTMVNEMLCQMEVHDGIFCCATNLVAELDQASLRRFSLKVEFLPLRQEQLAAAFLRTLASLGAVVVQLDPETAQGLARLGPVCLGDLNAARRNCGLFADEATAGQLLVALRAELAAKGGAGRRVGFGA